MATLSTSSSIGPRQIPKLAPSWTLYAYTAFALLTIVAVILGFLRAGSGF